MALNLVGLAIALGVTGVYYYNHYWNNVNSFLLLLISLAEKDIEHGENMKKLAYVYDNLVATYPMVEKFMKKQDILILINRTVEVTKELLQNKQLSE